MGLLWRLVSPFVSTFNAAPTVKIHDPVLGVANRLLQAIVCCGIAVMLYTDPPLYTEAPNAKAKFFASSGTLAELQAAPATYCGEGHLYGYGDEYCESTRTAGFGLFCEYGLTCANFDYAELNVKGETEMIFPTIVKDLEVELGEASDAFKARCGEASEVRYAGAELTRAAYLENGVYETSDSGQARCKHMNNYWAKGAEGMAMVVQHSYTASTKIPEAYREGTNKDVPTYIHRHGDNLDARGAEIEDVGDWVYRDCTTTAGVHKKRCDFEANEAIRLSVGEWLRIAGIASLDDHNAAAYRPSAQEGVTRLSHRTTGVLVKVTMYYVADHWMKPELHILLQSDDGWHSTGSEVHYVDYPVYDVARDVFVSGRFFDRYKRAVKFEFVTNEGRLRVVEQNVIFLRITALLVFMAISGTLVTMIAQSLLGYKSKVYKAHTKDDVKLEEVGSEIAANAVVAAACFRVACRPGARRLGKGDVFRLLVSTGHEPRAAARLANFLVASDETGQGIGMTAFANLLADGVPVAAAVRIARNLGHSGSTKAFRVAPAPAGPDITVAGAYRADCNGTYTADGRWQGHCRWKHETNDVWLRRDGGGWCLLNIRQPSFVFYRVDGPSAKGKFRSAVKGIIRERRWRPLSFLWRRGNVQVPGAPPTHGWRDGGCGGGASPHLVFSASGVAGAAGAGSGDASTAAATERGAAVGAAGATAAGAAGGVGAVAGVGVPQAPWRPTPQAARASWWAEPAVWWAVRSALETRWRRWVPSRPGTPRISQLAPSPTPPARRATWQGSPPARARAPPSRARAPPERGRRSRACRWAARSAPPTPPRGWAPRWPGMPRILRPAPSPTPPARRATSTAPARICLTTSTLASTTTTWTSATTRAAFSRGLRTWSGAGSSSRVAPQLSHIRSIPPPPPARSLRPRNH